MNNIKEYLLSKKIETADEKLTETGFEKNFSFKPGPLTSLDKVEKLERDFALHVHAIGPAVISPCYSEGRISISWITSAIPDQVLPLYPKTYSLPVGTTASGEAKTIYLPAAPHVLVAGTTGSGKSYWMHNAIRWSIHQDFLTVAFDPKWGEFSEYSDVNFRHVPSLDDIIAYTGSLASEMDDRYRLLAKNGCKSALEFNSKVDYLQPCVVFIDELADIVMRGGEKWLDQLTILAQKGRAAGIHIVAATQAPTAKLLRGELKANFPVRVAFRTASATASRVILDQRGAESLTGAGDGVCLDEYGKTVRFKGYTKANATIAVFPKKNLRCRISEK